MSAFRLISSGLPPGMNLPGGAAVRPGLAQSGRFSGPGTRRVIFYGWDLFGIWIGLEHSKVLSARLRTGRIPSDARKATVSVGRQEALLVN